MCIPTTDSKPSVLGSGHDEMREHASKGIGAADLDRPIESRHPAVTKIDVAANRRMRNWSRRELFGRVLWGIAHPFFAWSPRLLWGWRRFMLRIFGAKIGRAVHIYPSVKIAVPWNLTIKDEVAIGDGAILYSLGPIAIGSRATVSQFAHLCAGTHNYSRADMPLEKPPISVGESAWICADAYVGPGVTVGNYAIVGARAVVVRDVAAQTIVVGNPARKVGMRQFTQREK